MPPELERELAKGRKTAAKVQTLILFKTRFKNVKQARAWVKSKGFKAGKVHETENSFRFRQRPPGQFGFFRTISMTSGVKAVVGR